MKVAIITGGSSGERDIAIKGAEFWEEFILDSGDYVDVYFYPEEIYKFLSKYKKYDLVIPFIHGLGGEDGQITAFLKTLNCRYIFSDFEVLNLTLNKYLTNSFVKSLNLLNIYIPRSIYITNFNIKYLNLKYFINKKLVIKPNRGGSSLDTFIWDGEDIKILEKYIKKILKYDDVLMQEFIDIKKEFSISFFGDYDKNPEIIGFTIIHTDNSFFDFEAKYKGQSKEIHFGKYEFAELYGLEYEKIHDDLLKIYKNLKIKTLARIDIIEDKKGNFYFLEVNTIPGFSKTSIYPQIAIKRFGNMINFWKNIKRL